MTPPDTTSPPDSAPSVPDAIARGSAAGLAGALVMTAAQEVEMRVTGRKPSMVPAKVAMKLLPVKPRRRAGRERLNWAVHFGHGITMGVVRGAMGTAGARGPAGGEAYFAALWGGDVALYHALGIAGPPWSGAPASWPPTSGTRRCTPLSPARSTGSATRVRPP